MKVKAINKNTNQQFDCEEIEIDGYKYYLYYNIEPKKIGQYYITKDNQVDIVKTGKELGKPILCTNNPNIDIPKIIEYSDILEDMAVLSTEENEIDDSIEYGHRLGFINGYNKSQETHSFSEKDMKSFGKFCFEYDYRLFGRKLYKELLQLWKEQQPKKVYYENS